MTAQERPAGRPTCSARSAGARRWNHDPAVIRRAIGWRATHGHEATAARFGVSPSTITRWRAEAAHHAPAAWPSDDDIAAYQQLQTRRTHARAVRTRWETRRRTGPLLIDSTGTQRRLQALAALGWRYEDIAPRFGASKGRVGHLATGLAPTVHRDTAAAVARIYDDLSMAAGPSARARAVAAGRGWPPPLAWDDESIDDPTARPHRYAPGPVAFDEVAVARAMHGDPVHLRPPERGEAIRRLTAAGHSAAAIAALLSTTTRSVIRHRNDTRRSA